MCFIIPIFKHFCWTPKCKTHSHQRSIALKCSVLCKVMYSVCHVAWMVFQGMKTWFEFYRIHVTLRLCILIHIEINTEMGENKFKKKNNNEHISNLWKLPWHHSTVTKLWFVKPVSFLLEHSMNEHVCFRFSTFNWKMISRRFVIFGYNNLYSTTKYFFPCQRKQKDS